MVAGSGEMLNDVHHPLAWHAMRSRSFEMLKKWFELGELIAGIGPGFGLTSRGLFLERREMQVAMGDKLTFQGLPFGVPV